MGFRNGVQDVAVALFLGNVKDKALREEMMDSPQLQAFRRQIFNMSQYAVNEICKSLRQLNATAPCSKCNVTGKVLGLGDEGPKTCPKCKGTGWEPVL